MSLLYTIVPPEIIFGEDGDEAENSVPPAEIVTYGRVRLLVRADGAGGATVVGIVSTDPRDYLDHRWQPGTRIDLPYRDGPVQD
ncbi:MAG: YlzJ-like family protein [Patescibacteria group bacterium]